MSHCLSAGINFGELLLWFGLMVRMCMKRIQKHIVSVCMGLVLCVSFLVFPYSASANTGIIPQNVLQEELSGLSFRIPQAVSLDRKFQEKLTLIKNTIRFSALGFVYPLITVEFDPNMKEPRGKVRGKHMTLSTLVEAPEEFLKLFVHELGHCIDLFIITAKGDTPDPSLDFYAISWQSPNVKHASMGRYAFVSGYAATNQYEDFAETLVWYVFHNEDFVDRAMRNDAMRQKYLFFAEKVFPNGAFQGMDFSTGRTPPYFWDTTKIPIQLQKYLYFLQTSIQ